MKIRTFFATAAAALVAFASGAYAQDASLTATYGEYTLSTGFQPDPYQVSVTAGGTIDASHLGSPCRGSVARAPDAQLTFTAGSLPLYIVVNSTVDTTLVVNGPDGLWYCDDDSNGGVNPQVTWNSPRSGVYDVWVGTFSGGTAAATLSFTELTDGEARIMTHMDNPVPTVPNSSLTAAYGEVVLSAGFRPDPHRISLTAGGNIAASGVSSSCTGSIAEAPDYQVTYNAGSLPLVIRTEASSDTTLVVNGPDGNWYCDDDSGDGTNPLMSIPNPQSGVYDVFIGAYGGNGAAAQLYMTELNSNAYGDGGGGNNSNYAGAVDPFAAANYGTLTLRAGFTPDPQVVSMRAGGSVAATNVADNCRGFVSRSPDLELSYAAGSLPLILSVDSSVDTTLVVNGPDGRWYCDDDGGNAGTNPALQFNNPLSGTYDIWVGTYTSGMSQPASLNVSELYTQ